MKKLLIIPIAALMMFSCQNNANDKALTVKDEKQLAIDSMQMVMDQQIIKLEKQKTIDSMQMVMSKTAYASNNKPQQVKYYRTHANPVAEAPVQTQAKKKMSPVLKGALIGAGVGAVGGAVIHKKKPAQGALIGGLIGAAAGAGTGAIIQAKKKKEQQNLAYYY